MKDLRRALAVMLVFATLAYAQGNTFDKIRYNGGTVQTKVDPEDWGNRLTVTPELIQLRLKDGQVLDIDPKSVRTLSYGQEAHRRVGTMIALGILLTPLALFGLFHKTRLHFVGIEYTTADGKPSGVLLQAHKNNYRAVLMALRGATGAPVVVAEEDRKYVPTGVEAVTSKGDSTGRATETPVDSDLGLVVVTSNVEGADVWVDGKFVGNTPARLNLRPGKHTIRVVSGNNPAWEREVEVLPKSEVTLNAALTKE